MGSFASKSFDKPDDTRSFEHGRVDMVNLAGSSAARATFEPGWKWSTSVKPIAGTDTCERHHVGYCLEGAIHVVHAGGDQLDSRPGAVHEILPGHPARAGGR